MPNDPPKVHFYDLPPDKQWGLVYKLADAAWRRETHVLIHCGDEGEARALDDFLWTFVEDAFVPHERLAGEGLEDPDARVVIVAAEVAPIAQAVLIQLAPVSVAFAREFETVIDFVDHRDDARLAASRGRFKAWREAGVTPEFHK
ncbi:MAG: DNA polymerase III subunit chi [Myxococcales bacterium]|nr:DNA polymerase III subunit chi [Myxococcales bacterium]